MSHPYRPDTPVPATQSYYEWKTGRALEVWWMFIRLILIGSLILFFAILYTGE